MSYTLPSLSYDFSALEPHIDARTMEIHHDKHHATYVTKLNGVIDANPILQEKELTDLLKNIESLTISDADKNALRNNGGGHLNHSLFWEIMGPEKKIDEELTERIKSKFGSIASFKEEMSGAGIVLIALN